MTPTEPPSPGDRPAGSAPRDMAAMFDDVSPRYDLLNRLMTLGQDRAWRAAMWREVPDDARVVLDLCTGSGSSLEGLRQPGRLVIGADVSLQMLKVAREQEGWLGWAPRLVAADAFRLPLRDASVECVTIAFGVRNLRPRAAALGEIGRVLRPGGRLVVLEATAPRGPLAPLHRAHLLHGVPLLGRLSPDPAAYAYLGRSILEFGPGDAFEAALASTGFTIADRRVFLLGATTLWVAERAPDSPARALGAGMQAARFGDLTRGRMPTRSARRAAEWRVWTAVQLAVSLGLIAVLVGARSSFHALGPNVPLERWQRHTMDVLIVVGLVGFAIRSLVLALRLFGAPPRP